MGQYADEVTFQAVVTIVGFNDAQPADNIGIALATTFNAK